MDLKDWGIFVGCLGSCLVALKYFVRAEFQTLKESLDKRYVLREVETERARATHERLRRLEARQ